MRNQLLILFIFLLVRSLAAGWHDTGYGKWIVARFECTPFPDTTFADSGLADNSVYIFVPAGYQAEKEIHLIIDHHGHGAIIDPDNNEKPSYPEIHRQSYQLFESRKNAILVMPQAARNRASSSAGRFAQYGIFAAFVKEICTFLKSESVVPDSAELGQIHINSFSGGYLITAMDISANPLDFISHIRSVHLWDSYYGMRDIYYDWVLKHRGMLFNTYTPGGGTRLLSQQMADSLEKIGTGFFRNLPATEDLPDIIIEPTDKSHGNVSRGEFAYGRYLKNLQLPDNGMTAVSLLSCIAENNKIKIDWESVHNTFLAGYRLWCRHGSGKWQLLADENMLTATSNSYLHQTSDRYSYRLQTVSNTGGVIDAPFYLAAFPSGPGRKLLIVHAENRRLLETVRGFDSEKFLFHRDSDLVLSAADWISGSFSSCSNTALQSGLIRPKDYSDIIWLTGNENTQAKLIDASEKKWLMDFIEQGGSLFLSGNYVANEFGKTGNINDLEFGERILGISGSDSVSCGKIYLAENSSFGFRSGSGPRFGFHQAIRPVITGPGDDVMAAYVKRPGPSGPLTVFTLSFSLADIVPEEAAGAIINMYRKIRDDAPLTPEPPAPIKSVALSGDHIYLKVTPMPEELIISKYDSARVVTRFDTIPALDSIRISPGVLTFVRICGLGGALAGKESPVIGGYSTTASTRNVLIVDGFERRTPANHRDFIIEHAVVFHELGYNIASADNQAVLDSLISLEDYDLVDWILGEESSHDHTFTLEEQQHISDYIHGGGKLMISGSEIGWDLQARAESRSDSLFLHEIFGVRFVDDNASTNRCYPVQNQTASDSFYFGITYPVDYPDVFSMLASGTELMQYPGGGTAVAGRKHDNGGTAVIAGFPLETVQPVAQRKQLFERLIHFMEDVK